MQYGNLGGSFESTKSSNKITHILLLSSSVSLGVTLLMLLHICPLLLLLFSLGALHLATAVPTAVEVKIVIIY